MKEEYGAKHIKESSLKNLLPGGICDEVWHGENSQYVCVFVSVCLYF